MPSRDNPDKSAPSLEGIRAFKGLSGDTITRLQKRCAWRRYGSGEQIIDYLDTSDDVYFIVAGQVRATIYSAEGKAVTFCDLSQGDIFGEFAAIDGTPRSASIEASTNCLVASMSAVTFREAIEEEPGLAPALLRHLVAKARDLTTRVYEFSTLAVNNRIHAELLRLARFAPRSGKSVEIAMSPTHAEIASRTSTHREAVTRELNRLARIGLIERKRRSLIIKDVHRLEEMIREATGE